MGTKTNTLLVGRCSLVQFDIILHHHMCEYALHNHTCEEPAGTSRFPEPKCQRIATNSDKLKPRFRTLLCILQPYEPKRIEHVRVFVDVMIVVNRICRERHEGSFRNYSAV